jgi:hypothetical protein
MSTTENFAKSTIKDMKEKVIDMIYNSEIELEERKLNKISSIIQASELLFNFISHPNLGNSWHSHANLFLFL